MFAFSASMDFEWPAHIVWPFLIALEDVPSLLIALSW
jgi:hypothetical protein